MQQTTNLAETLETIFNVKTQIHTRSLGINSFRNVVFGMIRKRGNRLYCRSPRKCWKLSVLSLSEALIKPRASIVKFARSAFTDHYSERAGNCEGQHQPLDSAFSAVSKPIFAIKYSLILVGKKALYEIYQFHILLATFDLMFFPKFCQKLLFQKTHFSLKR